jgi:hypothetical protein
MNDHDKDLISAYLDNETTHEEKIYVESLMDSNPEAFDYANQLKGANIEINQFFEDDEFKELESSVDQFLATNMGSKTSGNASIFDFNISKIFNPYSIGGYAATAAIILSLNFNFLGESQLKNNESINLLDSFSSELFSTSIDKMRGPEDKNFYKNAIQRLLEQKRFSGNISYGSSSYFIKILNYEKTNLDYDCFSGEIRERDDLSNFLYCESLDGNQNSLLITNEK